ncbi:hypothetical protein [Aureibacter tunicatorum]|uniref:Uncharacterized protein n=1 Tax=Aureibacter tunicatorum TaxID=866807 RepID=A0AAE4BTN0_9BACT|nr:hypothetical protein [Aureibacter tunicatorum]MDR6239817.1 hypothetical protein [Aureibacter tunicatorum]BDD04292.1 hypothetical protein AUTU_17750 [Aureibacter tunicatorum]
MSFIFFENSDIYSGEGGRSFDINLMANYYIENYLTPSPVIDSTLSSKGSQQNNLDQSDKAVAAKYFLKSVAETQGKLDQSFLEEYIKDRPEYVQNACLEVNDLMSKIGVAKLHVPEKKKIKDVPSLKQKHIVFDKSLRDLFYQSTYSFKLKRKDQSAFEKLLKKLDRKLYKTNKRSLTFEMIKKQLDALSVSEAPVAFSHLKRYLYFLTKVRQMESIISDKQMNLLRTFQID